METNDNILFSVNGVSKPVIYHDNTDPANEVTEIIPDEPPVWVRWGLAYLIFFLLLIVAICWFIKYPDKTFTNGVLNSINAPKEVVVISGGKLERIFVKENKKVIKGEILGYIESTADHSEVIALSELIDHSNFQNDISEFPARSFSHLGELQSAYEIFDRACISFSNYLKGGFYVKKRNMLDNDMNYLQLLHDNLLHHKSLLQQDLFLTDTTFNANEILLKEKVISAMEYRNEKSKQIAKQMTLPQINATILSNESQQNEKKKEIAELDNQILQQKDIFIQALNTFKSQVDDWKKKFLLIAPINGTVSFSSFLQENQQLKDGQLFCFINPGNTNYFVQIGIPQQNFGKIRIGQSVLLKFPAYPFQEFGSVNGVIDFISTTPTDSGYLAKVSLKNGLITNYKKQIYYHTGLSVKAEIITEDVSLLQRLFYNIRKHVN